MEKLIDDKPFDIISYHEKLISELCQITGMDRNKQCDVMDAINSSIVPVGCGLEDVDTYLELTDMYLKKLSKSLKKWVSDEKRIYIDGIIAAHYLAYLGGEIMSYIVQHERYGYGGVSKLIKSLTEKIEDRSPFLIISLSVIKNKLREIDIIINDFDDIFGKVGNYSYSPNDGILLVKHLTELQNIYIERLKLLYNGSNQ